jgi:hypothetical protein
MWRAMLARAPRKSSFDEAIVIGIEEADVAQAKALRGEL